MSEANVYMAEGNMIPPLPGSPAEGPPVAQQFGGQGANPSNGVPRFVIEPVRQADGTYVNVEFVDILTPGDPKTIPRHKVTPALRQKYAPWYDHFRKGLTMAPSGVPLEMWPVMTPAQVLTLKAINIFTVEQLISVADSQLHNIPMGRTLRNQAETWMKEKAKSDNIEEYRRDKEAMTEGMRMLEAQVAALTAALATRPAEAVADPEKRGPGRPPKAAAA